MIHPASKAIEAKFKEHDLKCTIHEIEDSSAVKISFRLESFACDLLFISRDDDTDVDVVSTLLLRVPDEKCQAILPVLNQINSEYRYFTFSMHEGGDIRAKFTFPASTSMELVGEVAFEMLVHSHSIFEDVYPTLMKAIWG